MLGLFHPSFEGVWKPARLADGFADRLATRVRSGLLPAAKVRRNQYEIVTHADDLVRFRSTTVLTGINIGWNDVELRIDQRAGEASFSVGFWTWTRYCVLLGLGLFVFFAAFIALTALFGADLLPEGSYSPRGRALTLGLPMMVFWCLLWPWIMVAMHKKFARQGFVRLLDEVNSQRNPPDGR